MVQKYILYLVVGIMLLIVTPVRSNPDTTGITHNPEKSDMAPGKKGATVAPFGVPIFNIYVKIGPFSPQERANITEQKINEVANDPFFRNDSIRLIENESTFDIVYNDIVITSVDQNDANAEGATRELVAKERMAKIIYAIQAFRSSTSVRAIMKDSAFSVGVMLLLITIITLINRLFKVINKKVVENQARIMEVLHLSDYDFFNRQRQLYVLLVLLKSIRYLLILVLLVSALLTVFYLLPWTKAFSLGILGFAIDPLKNILFSLWNYLPNFITIIVILIVARLIIRFFKFLRREVEKETLKIPGFYSDWALPTFNIFRVLIIIFTIVAVWPYLPGSGSQVFQGVSVMFGLIFSLTSASSLSNFMAGLTITYTRAFKLGDRVKIGEVTGDIIEKSMLVTKIMTIKNEEITVPNTKIMNSEVINYSTCAPEKGLIIHTTITIGYDAPWRQVQQLLISAALRTPQILQEPPPFVLQTALNDFYVSYQVNAYTKNPNEMAVIFSRLHQNIQDSFNEAGVEIMSPHYKAIRDGNTVTIPATYRGEAYETPAFKIENKENR